MERETYTCAECGAEHLVFYGRRFRHFYELDVNRQDTERAERIARAAIEDTSQPLYFFVAPPPAPIQRNTRESE
jgi:hypothetical protein